MMIQSVLFYQLLLAHFLSDYTFQTNKVFAIKMKYAWGVTLHAAICGLTWLVLSVPYLQTSAMWCYVIFFGFIMHLAIDKGKMKINQILGRDSIWFFLLDQVLHILCALAIVYLSSNIIPAVLPVPLNKFADPHFVNILTWFIVATYVSNILVFMLKINYFRKYFQKILLPSLSMKYFGMIERALIAALVWNGGWLLLLVPVVAAPGFYLVNQKKYNLSIIDLILSWALAIGVGIGLRFS